MSTWPQKAPPRTDHWASSGWHQHMQQITESPRLAAITRQQIQSALETADGRLRPKSDELREALAEIQIAHTALQRANALICDPDQFARLTKAEQDRARYGLAAARDGLNRVETALVSGERKRL